MELETCTPHPTPLLDSSEDPGSGGFKVGRARSLSNCDPCVEDASGRIDPEVSRACDVSRRGPSCPIRRIIRLPVSLFVVTTLTSGVLAYTSGQVDKFPTELSKTANNAPSYWIFGTGLSVTAVVVLVTYPRTRGSRADALVLFACIGMVGLGWICDGCWRKLHQMFASMCILSLLGLGLLRSGWRQARTIQCAAASYALHEIARLCWGWRLGLPDWRDQAMGLTQWCTIVALFASL